MIDHESKRLYAVNPSWRVIATAALVAVCAAGSVGASQAVELKGRVVHVADGDTLTILTADKEQIKIRLAEIDAPEKKQAFGAQSKESLAKLVADKDVRVVVQTKDRYGRTVGRIFVGEIDVNAEQVRRGMAWVYVKYLVDKTLLAVEEQARTKRSGLWSDASPVAPWEFRRR